MTVRDDNDDTIRLWAPNRRMPGKMISCKFRCLTMLSKNRITPMTHSAFSLANVHSIHRFVPQSRLLQCNAAIRCKDVSHSKHPTYSMFPTAVTSLFVNRQNEHLTTLHFITATSCESCAHTRISTRFFKIDTSRAPTLGICWVPLLDRRKKNAR